MEFKEINSPDIDRESKYLRAKERVKAMKGFFYNLLTYIFVIPLLIWLNYITTDFPWVFFPIFSWGFGLAIHGMVVFGYNPFWGKSWQERKIRQLMEEDDF